MAVMVEKVVMLPMLISKAESYQDYTYTDGNKGENGNSEGGYSNTFMGNLFQIYREEMVAMPQANGIVWLILLVLVLCNDNISI